MTLTMTNEPIRQTGQRNANRSRRLHEVDLRIVRLEQYLETQHTITRIIAGASAVETALPGILQAICETAGWDFGEVWYVNHHDNLMHCDSTWCRTSLQLPKFENSGRAITFARGKGLPGRVWASGQPAWVPNVVVDKNFARAIVAEHDGLRAGIAIPIHAEGSMIGTLTFFSRHMRPVDWELMQVLHTAGNQIGLFIERKRAEQDEREKERLLAALQERQRLARDLHDSVTQTLFSASVVAEMLPVLWTCNPDQIESSLQELHRLTSGALGEMRSLVSEMRSPSAACSDLVALLNGMVEKLTSRTNIDVQLDVDLGVTLPDDIQMTLYRITQESLNNIVKHASATQVWVRLYVDDNTLSLCIEDNGQGFDPSAIPEDHFGIAIMRERAGAIGSTFQVESAPGKGTCISIHTCLAANVA